MSIRSLVALPLILMTLCWQPASYAQEAPAAQAPVPAGQQPAAGAEPFAAPEPAVAPEKSAEPAASAEPPAAAQPSAKPSDEAIERARALAGEASALYDGGLYAEAIAKFNQALEIYRHPVIFFNLAKACEKLADYTRAADAYRQYLSLTIETTGAPASDQADTERTIELLREKAFLALPEVTIDSEPRGADVYLDGSEVLNGQTQMKTHLPEGTHKVAIRMAGYQSVTRDFEVRSREPVRFTFSLIREKNSGGILVDVNIAQARIHIDGKVVGVTPMFEPIEASPGRHQVMIEREDYAPWSTVVEVKANEVVQVSTNLHLSKKSFSWRGGLGISSIILGGGIVGASLWGRYYINDSYKDRGMYNTVSPNATDAPPFDKYKSMVYAGYGVGAGLAALGVGLLIWEVARKPLEVRQEDLVDHRKAGVSFMPTFGPDSVGIGAVAEF